MDNWSCKKFEKLPFIPFTIYTLLINDLQARVQEFARGGAQNLKAFFFFFFAFQFFRGGGPAQIIAEKMIFSTKKVAKYM